MIAVHTAGTTRLPWGTLGSLDYIVWNGALGVDLSRMATLRGAVSPSPWHFLLTYGVAAALTVGLATVMFLLWERPFQTLRTRLRPRSSGGR